MSFEILRDATLFAPSALGRRDLIIGAGKVLWIGERAPALDRALGARERDLHGLRVIPGLVDGHAHITGGGGEAGPATRVPPVPLSRFTRAGTTTVVGLLGTDDCTRSTSELVVTAKALSAEGITALCYTGGYHVPLTTLTGSARSDIALVQEIVGIGEVAISDHRSSQPSFDELVRLASEAHVGGLMSGKAGILHLHLGDGERGLELVRKALAATELPARVFHPTHVNRKRRLFDEAEALVERGVTIDVTAFPVAAGDDAWSAPDALVRHLEAGLPAERITVSSDGGGCLPRFDAQGRVTSFGVGDPGDLAGALGELLRRGLPLEDVLPAFTSNVAKLFRLETKGVLAAGADADLVVLDAEHRVRDVMARGRWHVRDGEVLVRGAFER